MKHTQTPKIQFQIAAATLSKCETAAKQKQHHKDTQQREVLSIISNNQSHQILII